MDGTGVGELAGQADQALATKPLPELFLIQSVDNDMRCDGTDADNYAPFAATLTEILKKITSGAPKAKILIVSSPWATVQNYGQVAAQLPGPRAANSGTGPCDQFDYDNDALYHMKITTDDITTSDGFHLTITGLRKQAALEWRVLGLGS